MPRPESFEAGEDYYSTLFHELTHSTGHPRRLARKGITDPSYFASHEYSKEELVAEMGAAMLSGVCGIHPTTIDNSVSYIASWIRVLRGSPRMAVEAGAQSQKAADWIRGIEYGEAEQ